MSVETATQQIGTLLGLSGRSLEEYTSLASIALHEEVEPLQTLLSFYNDSGVTDEEAAINLERILKGKKKFCEMRMKEQDFIQDIPFSRRSRSLLLLKQQPSPSYIRFRYPAHLSTIHSIVALPVVPGSFRYNIITSSKDETLHAVSMKGQRPETIAAVCSPVQQMIVMPDNKLVSVDQDGDLYVNNPFGPNQKGSVDEVDEFDYDAEYYGLEPLDKDRFARLTPDKTVQIWRHKKAHAEGMPIQTLAIDGVTAITRLPNGHLVTATDKSISVWDCSSYLRSICIHEVKLDASYTITKIVALSNSKVAFIHKAFPFRIYMKSFDDVLLEHVETDAAVHCLAVYKGELVAGCYDGKLYTWSGLSEDTFTTLFVGPAPITAITVLPDDGIACGDLYGTLHVINLPIEIQASQ
uniref:Anaphase-promoting complex subunit 4 WD40 domain-containing protein n=1 Tax=viral metagenome TaxID=1070528 RepID=A0A6C0ARG1_9ZZZZ